MGVVIDRQDKNGRGKRKKGQEWNSNKPKTGQKSRTVGQGQYYSTQNYSTTLLDTCIPYNDLKGYNTKKQRYLKNVSDRQMVGLTVSSRRLKITLVAPPSLQKAGNSCGSKWQRFGQLIADHCLQQSKVCDISLPTGWKFHRTGLSLRPPPPSYFIKCVGVTFLMGLSLPGQK